MKQSSKNLFLYKIQTTYDVAKIQEDIELISESLFSPKEKLEHILQTQVSYLTSELFQEIMKQEDILISDIDSIKSLMEEMLTLLKLCTVVILEIAIPPTNDLISLIGNKIKEIGSYTMVLEIHTNQNLIGGATIAYKGKYKNYSIKPILTSILDNYHK
jgi:F0F1-type ATP synthase delta subunit